MAKRDYHRWTMDELVYLRANAGKVPEREICGQLRLKASQVEKMASRMHLSLAYRDPGLVWCSSCAKWRTDVDADGRCPVCRMRERTDGHKERYRSALGAMTASQRADYLHEEAVREERADADRERRDGDRWKQRVKRAREVTHANPRKYR